MATEMDTDLPAPALAIDYNEIDDNLDAPLTSGSEYLRRVQEEAQQIPAIVVADIDVTNLNKNQTVKSGDFAHAPPDYAPPVSWQKEQAAQFSEVRKMLQAYKENLKSKETKAPNPLPKATDAESWLYLCFGKTYAELVPKMLAKLKQDESLLDENVATPASCVTDATDDTIDTIEDCEKASNVNEDTAHNSESVSNCDNETVNNHKEVTSGVRDDTTSDVQSPVEKENSTKPAADEVTAKNEISSKDKLKTKEDKNNLIGSPPFLSIVAFMDQRKVEHVLEYHIKWLEENGFSEDQGRWCYALLASIEKPLTPEMGSLIRTLSRSCSFERSKLANKDDKLLVHLNLLIALVARYFDQLDLADN